MSRLVPVIAAAFLATACNSQKSDAPADAKQPAADAQKAAAAAPVDPKAAAGKYEGGTVTNAELDEFAKDELKKLDDGYEESKYQLRNEALHALIVKRIIEARAAKEGVKAEDLVKREVTDKVPEPTEKEMKAVYEGAKAQGQPLPAYAEVKDQVKEYLINMKARELLTAYYEKVRSDAKIEALLAKPAAVLEAEKAAATAAAPAAAPQE